MKQYLAKLRRLTIGAYLSLALTGVIIFTIGITIKNSFDRQDGRVKAVKSSKIAMIYVTPTIYCLGGSPCTTLGPANKYEPAESTPIPTPNRDLLAYWKFDENRGKTANDSSGNKHTGKLKSNPDWVKGGVNSALKFDGDNDYVEVPDSKSLEGMDKITITAWIKSDLKEQKDRATIFSKWENGAGGVYVLRKWGSGISASIETTHRKDSYNTPKKWKGYSDKKWHNLAMTYNGSSLKLYVDCKLFSEEKNVRGKLKTDKRDIRIGAATNGNYFDGRIDEVKIYGKALNSDEIKGECESIVFPTEGLLPTPTPTSACSPVPLPNSRAVTITPSGTSDDYSKIQNAINNLGSGETLILEGNFLLKRVVGLKSNMTLRINGSIKNNITSGASTDLINIQNAHDVTITGPSFCPSAGRGELIGNSSLGKKTSGAKICGCNASDSSCTTNTGWGIRTCGSGMNNNNITIKNLYIHGMGQSGIAYNKGKNGLIENNITNNNGQNGIGFGDADGVVVRNNHSEGNKDSGLQFEDVFNFNAINNESIANVRHNLQVEHGVGGTITSGKYNNGAGDGIQIRNRVPPDMGISENIVVSGAESRNNATDGLVIISSERIKVQNGLFKNNGNYGINESSGDFNVINYNDVRNNAQNAGFRISGSHTTTTGNVVK